MRTSIITSLFLLASLLVILPGSGKYSFIRKPAELSASIFDRQYLISVDQVARYMVNEDSTVQLIDLRTEKEFRKVSIPGAINIPLREFFDRRPETYLYNPDTRYIFYSNSNIHSAYALTLAHGLGYDNCYEMDGGLNMWFETVMNSSFTGESISPRENALFEYRLKAKRFFTDINSLPDSLKVIYAESRRQAEKDLDGGCE
jgi:rhodanese-related sulfurtransferase